MAIMEHVILCSIALWYYSGPLLCCASVVLTRVVLPRVILPRICCGLLVLPIILYMYRAIKEYGARGQCNSLQQVMVNAMLTFIVLGSAGMNV